MQALLRRLHEHDEHFSHYQTELNNLQAGYFGEQRIDREFVGIESMQVASKILSRLGFEKVGDKRGRFYIIPEDCLLND